MQGGGGNHTDTQRSIATIGRGLLLSGAATICCREEAEEEKEEEGRAGLR